MRRQCKDGRFLMAVYLVITLGWIAAFSVASSGCATHEAKVRGWHDHYTQLMGTESYEVRYVPEGHDTHPEWCGWIGWDTELTKTGVTFRTPHVAYAPCATKMTAMHEVCHVRMQHHYFLRGEMSDDELEAEVHECMDAYELRERRNGLAPAVF